jgi:GGDEF domain-containing protein
MANLTEHLIKLTDHRDRDLLELTLAKALIDLLSVQRVIVSRLWTEDGERRWFDVVSLDARGGGKVPDPQRIIFQDLTRLDDQPDRLRCLQQQEALEVAWAGEDGPRKTYYPLFTASQPEEEGVLEVHSAAPLTEEEQEVIGQVHHVYRNMYLLLAYSDRDALTGLLNRKSLDDAYYSAVLEEIEGHAQGGLVPELQLQGHERRHRVPPNYWLGTVVVDNYVELSEKHGHLVMEEVTLLVARVMNSTFRPHDRLYRFGPAQFAALFHCPEESQAFGAFERMRVNVAKFSFPQVGHVTISAGFSRVLENDSPSATLDRAEQAAEFAHKQGGGQTCSHLDLVRRGFLDDAPHIGPVDIF